MNIRFDSIRPIQFAFELPIRLPFSKTKQQRGHTNTAFSAKEDSSLQEMWVCFEEAEGRQKIMQCRKTNESEGAQ